MRYTYPLVAVVIGLITICSCSKHDQDIRPHSTTAQHDIVHDRTLPDYDEWVDSTKSFQREYFSAEDITALDFDYFYDKYQEINTLATESFADTLIPYMKRTFMSVEYVDLEDFLSASNLLSASGRTALLGLKDDMLSLMSTSPTQNEIHEFCNETAAAALESASLNIVDQAAIFLSCVGIESSLDSLTEYDSGLQGARGYPQVRSSCNFGDIALDFIIIASVASVSVNALHALGLIGQGWDYDYDYSEIFGSGSGISISTLLALDSPALPYILAGSAIASILWNCFGLEEFFENLWQGIKNFFANIFGSGSEDCNDATSITAIPLNCSGDLVRFVANGAGEDIVAYVWDNDNTFPSSITTPYRSFDFVTTDDEVVIEVTPICSDEEETLSPTTQEFTISEEVENDPVTTVTFVNWPTNPSTSQTYRYHIYAGAGINESLNWSTDYGGTIVDAEANWVDVTFSVAGNRPVTATITNTCNQNFSTDTKTLFVN